MAIRVDCVGTRAHVTCLCHSHTHTGDLLPDDRELPDPRPPGCHKIDAYTDDQVALLPRTSVIIVQHNEAESTLRRTVASVLNRSPPSLLVEVVIVDDHSEWEVGPSVAALSPKVKVIRNEHRAGLIRSRMHGVDATTAETVTFLDSHCESASAAK